MKAFFYKYWFLIGLAAAMVTGSIFANGLESISSLQWLRWSIVMSVMFLMALPLPLAIIAETLRRPWAALLASGVNFILLPIFAYACSGWVNPLLATGLMVVAATPCTLASAAVWTRRAGGNDVAALMTTVITNGLSFVATPTIVWLTLSQSVEIDLGSMIVRLAILVLAPMLLAQLLAQKDSVGNFARQRRRQLSVLAQVGILLIVLFGTAQSTLKLNAAERIEWHALLVLVLVCGLLHIATLVAGMGLARVLRLTWPDQIAVAFSGSQKTLMIGLLVCIQLDVSLIPMVVYHAVQLVLDTFVADALVARVDSASSPADAT